jgi:hypothetical protein
MKYRSPTIVGGTVSAAPPPTPWKKRAARRELYDVERPHHRVLSAINSVATSMTGRRPNAFESGTHQRLDAPSIKRFTFLEQAAVSIVDTKT